MAVKENDAASALADMVVSMVNGRIRCRSPYLRNPEPARRLVELASSLPGMIEVKANSRVGSILFVYDPAVLDLQRMLSAYSGMLSSLLAPPVREQRSE
jgi:hypothetical protein